MAVIRLEVEVAGQRLRAPVELDEAALEAIAASFPDVRRGL